MDIVTMRCVCGTEHASIHMEGALVLALRLYECLTVFVCSICTSHIYICIYIYIHI